MDISEKLFIGGAMPTEQLPVRVQKKDDEWLHLLRKVARGYGREINVLHATIVSVIRRLEKKNKIKQGEYRVQTSKTEAGIKCFIIHEEDRPIVPPAPIID